jgi:sugar phosphate isomerase/epimerase
MKKGDVGIQLWTLRDTIQKDTLNTLKQVSKAGYTLLEPYGFDGSFYGITAGEFRKMAEDLGMRVASTHTGITMANADLYVEKAVEAGLQYLVLPSAGDRQLETIEDYEHFAAEMNLIGKKTQKAGIMLGYHNHSHEFKKIGETIPYDIMLKNTDPSLVCFEVDLFWMIKGGFQPIDYFKNYPGRFALLHVKDMATTGESTVIGQGTIDFKSIFAQSALSGMKQFYVEQEEYKATPIQCVVDSYKYISQNLI